MAFDPRIDPHRRNIGTRKAITAPHFVTRITGVVFREFTTILILCNAVVTHDALRDLLKKVREVFVRILLGSKTVHL